jgi:hypothetical protein
VMHGVGLRTSRLLYTVRGRRNPVRGSQRLACSTPVVVRGDSLSVDTLAVQVRSWQTLVGRRFPLSRKSVGHGGAPVTSKSNGYLREGDTQCEEQPLSLLDDAVFCIRQSVEEAGEAWGIYLRNYVSLYGTR